MNENQNEEKESLTIAIEISGVSFSKSMSFCHNEKHYYLYPSSYLNNIQFIKKELNYINSEDFNERSVSMESPLKFETGAQTSSYIITNLKLNLLQLRIELYNEIYAYFEILLKIFSLIFEQFINITRIFIFKKEPCKYSLKRVICRKIRSFYREKKPFNYRIQNFEAQIPNLISNFSNSPENLEIKRILNEFIHAKKTTLIELEAIYLWNFIEHLANLYSKLKERNLLIDSGKFENLKQQLKDELENIISNNNTITPFINSQLLLDEIGRVINSLNFTIEINQPLIRTIRNFKKTIRIKIESILQENDILIEGYNKQKIVDIYINLLSNFPGIIILIKNMCNDINYPLSQSDENLFFYMNKVRNFYFHEAIDNDELYILLKREIEKKEKREINTFNHKDFNKLIQQFALLIEKILFHMLSFPSDLKENKYSHSIQFIKFSEELHPDENNVSFFRNLFEQMYEDYTKERKYHFLIKFIQRTIENYKKTLKKVRFSGIYYVDSPDTHFRPHNVRFNDTYTGVLENIKEINVSQMVYNLIIYLKKKEDKLDSLLHFQALTDIDFRMHRLSFEADLLDFQIGAEEHAMRDKNKYPHIKNAISPLPVDFLEDDYYRDYFAWSQEYKKKLDEKPKDLEVLIPIIIITLEKLKDFERFTDLLKIKNIQYQVGKNFFNLRFSRFQGTGNLKGEVVSSWRDEVVNQDLNNEFLLKFPFFNQNGFLFITNSPRLFAIHSLLYSKLSTMPQNFIGFFILLHYYFCLLYEIEKNLPLSIDYIENIKEQRKDLKNITLHISNPEHIKVVFQFREKFLDLLLKILVYPKLIGLYNIGTIAKKIKENGILPHLKRNYKGTAWLSFGLSVALYVFISNEKEILEKVNDKWIIKLISILEDIKGKNVSQEFIVNLFDLFDSYIQSFLRLE
ncbi:MAG: hypothetical protein ACFFA0_09240 [Promethearchaeota archaeon]